MAWLPKRRYMKRGLDSTNAERYEAERPLARGGAPSATNSFTFWASLGSIVKAANACAEPCENLFGFGFIQKPPRRLVVRNETGGDCDGQGQGQ